ncbi:6541_t:CDS:2 [Funneliformis geosporum]|uniref:Pyruvate kinase n=1 Tax=Funneliformis geosporum TaxID=1117311 RepID=A0A9W4WQ57_9GLOM|nr:6541_t:CDS:2 [Funneliformis geosporum]CAI2163654.1 19014_t:CDS:2 [Funneliformis geosporum]
MAFVDIKTNLEWVSTLSIDRIKENIRKTSIICTIGPKTNSAESIKQLRNAGMNIVRMNFSHGSHEYHKSVIDHTRENATMYPGRPVAIALDTKGPEIRTGVMRDNVELPISSGHVMIFSTNDEYAECCDLKVMYVDYKNITKVIEVGKRIYVDDGVLSFEVLEIHEDHVKVKALNNGKLCSKKGVNLPNTDVDLPAVSVKDENDILFGVENKVDMIFASFIRTAQDVRDIRKILGEGGKSIKIISKIENQQGLNNFDDILKESDGIMVARGDLGIEIPASHVFVAQKKIISKCNIAGKPVVCATQMLESMTFNPRPTRAEVSDVANAVLDGADCVMLSGETAKGSYPIQAVQMMNDTCVIAESVICYPPLFNELRAMAPVPTGTTETVASAAVSAAHEQNAGCILVLSTSGDTARLVSKYRPRCPIITVTRVEQTARQIHLSRGCYPFIYDQPKDEDWQEDVENRIKWGIHRASELKILKSGDPVIAIQGWKGGLGNTNTLRILATP